MSNALLESVFFDTATTSLDGYLRDASYNRTSASGSVFGPYTLDREYLCSEINALRDKAIELADGDVTFPSYTRLFIVFRVPSAGCIINGRNANGIGTLGCQTLSSPGDGSFTASTAWLVGNSMGSHESRVNLAAHETGHNLGLHHSSSRDHGVETLAAPGVNGTIDEYGDPDSSVMSESRLHRSQPRASMQLMPVVTLRNVPEETILWLRGRAAGRGRSVNAELLDLVETAQAIEMAAAQSENPYAATILLAARRGVRTPRSAVAILRRDRARSHRS